MYKVDNEKKQTKDVKSLMKELSKKFPKNTPSVKKSKNNKVTRL